MINVGVIGCGYWGPVLIRNFSEIGTARVKTVADLDQTKLTRIRDRYPAITTTTDATSLIRDPEIDAVAVATPVSTHFELAMAALDAGKHVLVEKPMTQAVHESEALVKRADELGLVLQVDHPFIYTAAVRKMKEAIDAGTLGTIQYYDSVRVNLGLFQHDVNVLWDLAVHDLSILDYLVPYRPVAISATGVAHVEGQPHNVAYLTLLYSEPFIAHIHVNWLSPVKIRKTLLGGDKSMVVYDDLEPSEKVCIYDRGIVLPDSPAGLEELRVGYRAGDMLAPHLDRTEALRTETLHFTDCIANDKRPLTDGSAGLRTVKVLDAANRSLAQNGAPISVE